MKAFAKSYRQLTIFTSTIFHFDAHPDLYDAALNHENRRERYDAED